MSDTDCLFLRLWPDLTPEELGRMHMLAWHTRPMTSPAEVEVL